MHTKGFKVLYTMERLLANSLHQGAYRKTP